MLLGKTTMILAQQRGEEEALEMMMMILAQQRVEEEALEMTMILTQQQVEEAVEERTSVGEVC